MNKPELKYLKLDALNESPDNPRKRFSGEAINDLAGSIAARGILTPLLVRPAADGNGWEIGAGHRRLRAARQAGMTEVPCLVREMSDEERAKRAKSKSPAASPQEKQSAAEADRKRKEDQKKEEERKARWKKALPAIFKAVGEAVRTQTAGADGYLADLIVNQCTPSWGGVKNKDILKRGTTAEDLIRHAAHLVLCNKADGWGSEKYFPAMAKELGLDIWKIVNEAVPPEQTKIKSKGKKKAKKEVTR